MRLYLSPTQLDLLLLLVIAELQTDTEHREIYETIKTKLKDAMRPRVKT